jgi:hypothetical protein
MDDDLMQHRDPEDDELARRLEAYAEVRLSPELSATTRMRAQVMAAAHRQAALVQADRDRALAAEATPAVDRDRNDRTRRSPWRRSVTLLLAAGLTLAVGVGSAAAAQPGGPLYPVRIWSETLTLPGEADARAQAELKRLADRLAEAAAATGAGDSNAANAALEAYDAIVQEATLGAGNDVSAAATLEAGIRSNIDVLTVLVTRVGNDRASEAIQRALERAIERSDSAVDKMHGKPDDTPGNGPGGNPGIGPKSTGGPDRTPNPNKPSPDPSDKTPKPHPTPNDDPTTNAQSTTEPGRTPGGGPPSERPGGGGGPPSTLPGGGGGGGQTGNGGGGQDD